MYLCMYVRMRIYEMLAVIGKTRKTSLKPVSA